MTMVARLTALLLLIAITLPARGEQGQGVWGTAPPATTGPATVIYGASVPGTLVLPPPPPMTTAPVPIGPVVTYRPLVPVVPMPAQYYVGQGLLGQPKLYVPAQPVRNFLRYLSP